MNKVGKNLNVQGEALEDVEIEQAGSLGIVHHDFHQTEPNTGSRTSSLLKMFPQFQTSFLTSLLSQLTTIISHSRRQQHAGWFMSTCMAGALFFPAPCRSDDTEKTREISIQLPRVSK